MDLELLGTVCILLTSQEHLQYIFTFKKYTSDASDHCSVKGYFLQLPEKTLYLFVCYQILYVVHTSPVV